MANLCSCGLMTVKVSSFKWGTVGLTPLSVPLSIAVDRQPQEQSSKVHYKQVVGGSYCIDEFLYVYHSCEASNNDALCIFQCKHLQVTDHFLNRRLSCGFHNGDIII